MLQTPEKIKVLLRVCPANSNSNSILSFPSENTVQIASHNQLFHFDHIFTSATQAEVFSLGGKNLVQSCLQGFNCCLFAYGQTGSGKTYTLLGNKEQPGIVHRSIENLLLELRVRELNFSLKASFYQIYNQQFIDLLDSSEKKLLLREDLTQGCYLEGIMWNPIQSLQEFEGLLASGINRRRVASTDMNKASSRSHSVLTINLKIQTKINCYLSAKINFVDLAGSERQKRTSATGQRLKQAGVINKSLSVLGQVINALGEARRKSFVPFRDSKLTMILKDSLGGSSKTVMMTTISSLQQNYSQSLSTLKFAQRAKSVMTLAHRNQEFGGSVDELKSKITQLQGELKAKNEEIFSVSSKGRVIQVTSRLQPIIDSILAAQNGKLPDLLRLVGEVLENDAVTVLTERVLADQQELRRRERAVTRLQEQVQRLNEMLKSRKEESQQNTHLLHSQVGQLRKQNCSLRIQNQQLQFALQKLRIQLQSERSKNVNHSLELSQRLTQSSAKQLSFQQQNYLLLQKSQRQQLELQNLREELQVRQQSLMYFQSQLQRSKSESAQNETRLSSLSKCLSVIQEEEDLSCIDIQLVRNFSSKPSKSTINSILSDIPDSQDYAAVAKQLNQDIQRLRQNNQQLSRTASELRLLGERRVRELNQQIDRLRLSCQLTKPRFFKTIEQQANRVFEQNERVKMANQILKRELQTLRGSVQSLRSQKESLQKVSRGLERELSVQKKSSSLSLGEVKSVPKLVLLFEDQGARILKVSIQKLRMLDRSTRIRIRGLNN